MTSWTLAREAFDSPAATGLRRDYYAEVASRYWQGPRPPGRSTRDWPATPWHRSPLPRRRSSSAGTATRPRPVAACCCSTRAGGAHPGLCEAGVARPEGAGALLARLESEARPLGARRLVLDTRLDLAAARALYVRHGFAEIPAYSAGPYSQIWYSKELRAAAPDGPGPRRRAAASGGVIPRRFRAVGPFPVRAAQLRVQLLDQLHQIGQPLGAPPVTEQLRQRLLSGLGEPYGTLQPTSVSGSRSPSRRARRRSASWCGRRGGWSASAWA